MNHRHYCDIAGHDWQCEKDCECICGFSMEGNDHSDCPVELRDCRQHQSQESTDMPAVAEKTSSKRGRLKFPPEHRLRRALRRLSDPGFAGVCVSYGHRYKRFSLEIQDAHLLRCPSYPEEARQQICEMQRRRAKQTPR
jgi:hypothetical protein